MVIFKFKELLQKNKMSRYRFRQLTEWNYKRINSFYFGTAKLITVREIEVICNMFNCELTDIVEFKK